MSFDRLRCEPRAQRDDALGYGRVADGSAAHGEDVHDKLLPRRTRVSQTRKQFFFDLVSRMKSSHPSNEWLRPQRGHRCRVEFDHVGMVREKEMNLAAHGTNDIAIGLKALSPVLDDPESRRRLGKQWFRDGGLAVHQRIEPLIAD